MQTIKNTLAGTFAIVATVVTVAAATPLRAETVGVPVAYGDLNIASESGAATLDARIRRAAVQVCRSSDAGSSIQVGKCRRDAIGAAKAKLAMSQGDQGRQYAAR